MRFRISCIAISLLLFARAALAVIAFDTASNNHDDGTTTVTVSHTVAAVSNSIILACVYSGYAGDATGVTYNGQALTQIGASINLSYTGGYMSFWYKTIASPDGGAHDLIASYNAPQGYVAVVGVSYNGVDVSTPLGTPVSNAALLPEPITAAVTSTSGQVTVDCGATRDNGEGDVTSGQTLRGSDDPDTTFTGTWVSEATSVSPTMSYSWGEVYVDAAIIAVPLRPSVGAARRPVGVIVFQ